MRDEMLRAACLASLDVLCAQFGDDIPYAGGLDRGFILGAHRRGQQVYAWTVNTAEDIERLLDLGIDGVITDQSALARKILDQYLSRPKTERAARRVRAWLAD